MLSYFILFFVFCFYLLTRIVILITSHQFSNWFESDSYARTVEGAFADFAYSLAFSASTFTLIKGRIWVFSFVNIRKLQPLVQRQKWKIEGVGGKAKGVEGNSWTGAEDRAADIYNYNLYRVVRSENVLF